MNGELIFLMGAGFAAVGLIIWRIIRASKQDGCSNCSSCNNSSCHR